jgi:DNA-binding response OmpR family regulator
VEQPRILIVDDEPNIRFVLERTLRHEGYTLDSAVDGSEALEKIRQQKYALLLLDLQMSPVGGIQVLQALRRQDPETVVIILTAHGSMESAVEALRLGAFDYLFKPATPTMIRQRVQEGLIVYEKTRRQRHLLTQIDDLRQVLVNMESAREEPALPAASRFLRSGKLLIDQHHRIATFNDQLLELTTTEFNLLACLVEASPKPVSPRQLVNSALGYDSEEAEAREIVKWHIHHLRQKIEPNPTFPQYIKTVRYQGYLWSG